MKMPGAAIRKKQLFVHIDIKKHCVIAINRGNAHQHSIYRNGAFYETQRFY